MSERDVDNIDKLDAINERDEICDASRESTEEKDVSSEGNGFSDGKEKGLGGVSYDDIKELMDTAADISEENDAAKKSEDEKVAEDDSKKIFQKFKIKDIVFLAIVTVCMLLTGAVMPLLVNIPVFGIIQLGLGLQFSIFPVIGMMKVRKVGSLLLISLFSGIVLVFMNPIMFVCLLICAFICEVLSVAIFKGYKKDASCVMAGTLYLPLTLPFLYVWYKFIYTYTPEAGEAVSAFIGAEAGAAIGISIAVIAVCFVGSMVGMIISRELKKAGVLKK